MKILVLVLVLCGANQAWSEIYTWKDKGGTAHFTNSMYEIPDRYRSRAKVLNLGIEQKSDIPAQQAGQQPAASQTPALPTTTIRPQVLPERKSRRHAGRPQEDE